MKSNIKIAYFTAEGWPTFRVDVSILFGKYIARHPVEVDLFTECDDSQASRDPVQWGCGEVSTWKRPESRGLQYIFKFLKQLRVLATISSKQYDVIQVRDMPLIALMAVVFAKMRGIKFIYWMSFPQSEGQIARAKARGPRAGMRYWFPLIQGVIGRAILYRLVLPAADHVIVQSEQMKLDVVAQGCCADRLTPIPMGYDSEAKTLGTQSRNFSAELTPKDFVLAYLGTLDRARKIEVLLESLQRLLASGLSVRLLLIGDTEDSDHRQWLHAEAQRLGVEGSVDWSGWVPMSTAWSLLQTADIGLSPFPRGELLDSASPTKVVEYMALGLPVLANDNPDQKHLVESSGCGRCCPLNADLFATALHEMLADSSALRDMGLRGQAYIAEHRAYRQIAANLSALYQRVVQ